MRPFGSPPMQPRPEGPEALSTPAPRPLRYRIHIALFLLTLVTTTIAGMMWENLDPWHQMSQIYRGLPYALTLLGILFCHEMGHYLTARYYGMDVTLPYFLPVPPPILTGTFGAFIRMRSLPPHRRALLNVGAAGPIAGFCIALPMTAYAYLDAQIVPVPTQAVQEIGRAHV